MNNKRVLITGGAGFIGANAAARFLDEGWSVTIFDNLSRTGGKRNLEWLNSKYSPEFCLGDLRKPDQISSCIKSCKFDYVLHCAAQVAVTTSVTDPRDDFETNAFGTFNLLEAVRLHCPEAFVVYASTNKVYGNMEELKVVERNGRYEYASIPNGVDESFPLDFHSPYGCSKGAADQYVHDYSRIYDLQTVVFRQSCIYGYRQFGVEDQGWVAWFIIAHALNRPVTVFGDGKQTRDVLFIDDLVDAYLLAFQNRGNAVGNIYNIGGGPANQLSLLELVKMIETVRERPFNYSLADWRPGDQRVFVADITKASREFGWTPKNGCVAGVEKLIKWVDANTELFD